MSRFCLIFLFAFPALLSAQGFSATVREYRQTFATYPFSDPDPVAKAGKLYPYFRYDGFTDKSEPREWKVVELENSWIKVMILPEVGGKIWTAIEKKTGKPFIYYNHAVKFRDVAMRGPWTSGGIESNYGIFGHTPATAVPVNYETRRNPDGSAVCVIGAFDLLTRTRWTLSIELPADKAYFKTRSHWHNGNPLEQPYYTWMNVGIKSAGNLEFTYPGRRHLGHDGEVYEWPRQTGLETEAKIPWYERNNFGGYKSYHVFGQYTSFFGGYWHDEDFGMGRYAPRDEKPGKKIWIWGLSRQGMIWEKLLTDTDGQYVEVQSGRLFTQSAPGSVNTPFKYRAFAPYATDEWTEYWFPVLRTGGIAEANPYGALNLKREKDDLNIAFCPLQNTDDTLRIFEKGRLLHARRLMATPLETLVFQIPFSGKSEDLEVELGARKLYWTGNPHTGALDRPTEMPADFKWKTAYGYFLKAKAASEQRFYDQTLLLFDSSLALEPYFMPALTGKAQEYLRLGRYGEARNLAKQALSVDTYDPEANYCWGLANSKLEKNADAKDGFELASPDPGHRSGAFTELAKIYLREKDRLRAAEYAEKALRHDPNNVSALQIKAVLERLDPKPESAARQIAALDPFNPVAWFEMRDWDRVLQSPFRDELPHENYLEAAAWYSDLNLFDDARRALESAPAGPEQHYWLAWLEARRGNAAKSDEYLDKAAAASPYLVFPFRPESIAPLRKALERRPHWKTRYYLAILLRGLQQPQEADQLLAACGNEPDYAPFYLTRARDFSKYGAERDLQRAQTLDPGNWRPAIYLMRHYKKEKNFGRALEIAEKAARDFPENYMIGMEYADALLHKERYAECLVLLEKINVIPYEGATDGRGIYRNACLLSALHALENKQHQAAFDFIEKSKKWPENLGVGMPYPEDIDLRTEHYLSALALEGLGKKAEAREILAKAAESEAKDPMANYAAMLAHLRLGKRTAAQNVLSNWLKTKPNNPTALWAKRVFEKGRAQAGKTPESANAPIFERLR
jgi:tetratricopeptide (TPR) repeat protein